jgi:hypothetical protein
MPTLPPAPTGFGPGAVDFEDLRMYLGIGGAVALVVASAIPYIRNPLTDPLRAQMRSSAASDQYPGGGSGELDGGYDERASGGDLHLHVHSTQMHVLGDFGGQMPTGPGDSSAPMLGAGHGRQAYGQGGIASLSMERNLAELTYPTVWLAFLLLVGGLGAFSAALSLFVKEHHLDKLDGKPVLAWLWGGAFFILQLGVVVLGVPSALRYFFRVYKHNHSRTGAGAIGYPQNPLLYIALVLHVVAFAGLGFTLAWRQETLRMIFGASASLVTGLAIPASFLSRYHSFAFPAPAALGYAVRSFAVLTLAAAFASVLVPMSINSDNGIGL